ncbi:MFS transporter [Nonomuraea sp. NPDC046802]|uniref:MFS transporter n=1 Tax=Nonomuraea sp. NPDC046802 TaxID=3154919 RepID=UPI0033F25FA3
MTGAVGLLLTSQALRGLGYGIAAVQLGAILRLEGLAPAQVGLMLAAILVGTLVSSPALARWGDRVGRRRVYAALYGALICAGIVIAAGAPLWLLAAVAMTGALSVEVMESGPFTTLEQVMLAGTGRPQREVMRGFGLYNAAAAVTNTARYLTRPAGPALAVFLLPLGLALPFVIAGAAKTAYDLTLWRIFRSVRLPSERPS